MINNLIKLNNEKLINKIIINKKLKKECFDIKNVEADFNFKINNFFSKDELKYLLKKIKKEEWLQVDINGYRKYKNKRNKKYKGSQRLTIYSKKLSKIMWKEIKKQLPKNRIYKEGNLDVEKNSIWKPIGVNPLLRLMKYEKNSLLVPHYDAPYNKSKNEKTLTTIVLYLSNNKTGATRFIKEKRKNHKYKDNKRTKVKRKDIIIKEKPKFGKIVIFDHRLYHDSELLKEKTNKIILRTDIIYKKIK